MLIVDYGGFCKKSSRFFFIIIGPSSTGDHDDYCTLHSTSQHHTLLLTTLQRQRHTTRLRHELKRTQAQKGARREEGWRHVVRIDLIQDVPVKITPCSLILARNKVDQYRGVATVSLFKLTVPSCFNFLL
jgi:hypothetical protein